MRSCVQAFHWWCISLHIYVVILIPEEVWQRPDRRNVGFLHDAGPGLKSQTLALSLALGSPRFCLLSSLYFTVCCNTVCLSCSRLLVPMGRVPRLHLFEGGFLNLGTSNKVHRGPVNHFD